MLVSLSPRDNNHLHFGVYLSSFFSVCMYVCTCTKCYTVQLPPVDIYEKVLCLYYFNS